MLPLAAVYLIDTHVAIAAPRNCDKLLHEAFAPSAPTPFSTVEMFITATTDGAIGPDPRSVSHQLMEASEAFKTQFLERKMSRDRHSEADLKMLISTYHSQFMAQFLDGEILKTLRNESLKEDLQEHGFVTDSANSGLALAKLSKANLIRIMRQEHISQSYLKDAEIAAFTAQFNLEASRYSHTDLFAGETLISSRQIKRYGLLGGYQSRYDFNTKFLKSDNNVFFFLNFVRSDSDKAVTRTPIDNIYGDVRYVLKNEYAKENGWISPFLMYPEDLAEFSALANGDGRLRERNTGKSSPNFTVTQAAIEAKKLVHTFDFTFTDYLSLMRTRLGSALVKVKRRGSYELRNWDALSGRLVKTTMDLQQLMKWIETSSDHLETFLFQDVTPLKMELKVPVAVPRTAFQ